MDTKGKIVKTCNIITILLKVCRIVCYVAIGFIVAAIGYLAFRGNLDPIFQSENFTIAAPISKDWLEMMDRGDLIWFLLVLMVKLVILTATFYIGEKFFADAGKQPSPFTMKNVVRLRWIAVLYFVANLFSVSASKGETGFDISFGGFIGAFIIWGISYMFEYGYQLQEDADETL